jgi:hypothetical protein
MNTYRLLLSQIILFLCLVAAPDTTHAGLLSKLFGGLFSKSETVAVKAVTKEAESGIGHLAGDGVSAAAHSNHSTYVSAQLGRIAAKCAIYSSESSDNERKKELRCTAMQNQFLQCVSIKTKEGLTDESASDFCAVEENAAKAIPQKEETSWWVIAFYFIILMLCLGLIRFVVSFVWTHLTALVRRLFSSRKDSN